MEFSITSILLALVLAPAVYLLYKSRTRPKNFPPGPLGIPFVGSIHYLTDMRHLGMMKLAKQYGNVFSLKLFHYNVVIVNGFEAIKELFDRGKEFCDRGNLDFNVGVKWDGEKQEGIIDNRYGPSWSAHRKLFYTVMREIGMGRCGIEHIIQVEARYMMQEYNKIVDETKPFDPFPAINIAVLNVIASFIFGDRYEYDNEKMKRLININNDILHLTEQLKDPLFILSVVPMLKDIWIPRSARNFKEKLEKLIEFCGEEVEFHKKNLDSQAPRDFIDYYLIKLQAQKPSDKPVYTEHGLRITLMDLFMAGGDTTATTLRWAILYMADRKDVQKKVQNEIDEVLGFDKEAKHEDRIKMPYTEATIHEVQRFSSIVASGLLHIPICDVEFQGYQLPRRTAVIPNHYSSHFQEDQWKNAQHFDPENFLDENGKFAMRDAFVPFGGGIRICPGMAIAKQELFLFFVAILQKYDIRPEKEGCVSYESDPGILQYPKPQKYYFIKRELSKPVRVTKETEDGALELDLNALHSILTQEDLNDYHLAVVSIAGCLRTGKSFLMNFLIRYMREAGWQNPDWIGDDDTAVENCMEWKSGKSAHTKGIIIWNEVFKIDKPGSDNEKIAILLMDTQGLFDQTMTKEDNVKLFSWTMMMSSSIMLNIKSRIDERELDYLQFYVDFAKAMKKSGKEMKPFQDLLFLIRDWEHCDEDPYGNEGGNSYLSDFLKTSVRGELTEVRKNLRSSFETLGCFLLPHPGSKVIRKDFTGYKRDIDRDFLLYVEKLAEIFLHPVNVKKKHLHGKALTGHDLWSLLVGCNDAFKDGQLPTVDSMSVTVAKARNEICLHESLKIYNEAMRKIEDGEKLSDDELKSRHAEAQKTAIEQFDAKTDFGGAETRVLYRQRLVEECQYAFKNLTRWNDIHMRNARIFSADKIHELWSAYREEMREIMKKDCCDPNELELEHERCRDEALRRYQVEAGEAVSHFTEHTKILIKDIEKSFKKINQANEEKILLKNLSEAGLDAEYTRHLTMFELSQQYREEFTKFMPVYIDDKELENTHRYLRDSYFDMFEKYVSKTCGEQKAEYREKFMKILDEECDDSFSVNERNKHHLKEIEEQSLETLKAKYTEIMESASKDFHVPPKKLQASHDKLKKELTTELAESYQNLDSNMEQDLESRAEEKLLEAYRDVEERNKEREKYKPVISDEALEKLIDLAKTITPHIITGVAAIKKFMIWLNKNKSVIREIRDVVRNVASVTLVSEGAIAIAAGATIVAGAAAAYGIYKYHQEKKINQASFTQ